MQRVGCTGMLSEIYNVYKPEIWQVREGARDFLEDQEYLLSIHIKLSIYTLLNTYTFSYIYYMEYM